MEHPLPKESNPPRIYAHLVDPREHPDYERRAVRPPDWEIFHNRTQMTSMRIGHRFENLESIRLMNWAT